MLAVVNKGVVHPHEMGLENKYSACFCSLHFRGDFFYWPRLLDLIYLAYSLLPYSLDNGLHGFFFTPPFFTPALLMLYSLVRPMIVTGLKI
jgi:hypothetical protein